jgi:two-component system phosphate regulon sensor histidine kinase PhoR
MPRRRLFWQLFPSCLLLVVCTIIAMSVALPISFNGRPLQLIDLKLLLAAVCIFGVTIGVSLLASRRIARPLDALRHTVTLFASGHLTQRAVLPESEEIANLAEAMNDMASQLNERISTILRHRNEQEAILSSMTEGVLAVDMDERLISMNTAAAEILHADRHGAMGRTMHEIIRNTSLQQFIALTLTGTVPVEGDVVFWDGSERYLQVNGAVLQDALGTAIGAVIVLNDVTRLRRLENMRRDFVANVSHELRTPITSIKGFVESLLDGALQEPALAEHFLQVVAKQVDRLDIIIEDLLALSLIEQGSERAEIGLEDGPVRDILQTAVQVCAVKSAAKQIAVEIRCPDNLHARLNPPLLEQAVINLVDNAVKYSNKLVIVAARQEDEQLVIEVIDDGCGIAPEHLSRLFERFYRVDKARSRKLGGTGLGLAIVKHIAQAHGGYAAVTSTLGQGSVFSIHYPVI